MALEERSVSLPYDVRADLARPPPRDEPSWRGYVWLDGEGLDLWSLVDGHLPAWDTAQLALRASTREARAAAARSRTYLTELTVDAITVDSRSGRATFEAEGVIPFELEPSSYSAGLPRGDLCAADALVGEDASDAEVDAFWRERLTIRRPTMSFVLTEARVETVQGVPLLRARPYRFTSPGPVVDVHATPYDPGTSHGITMQVAFACATFGSIRAPGPSSSARSSQPGSSVSSVSSRRARPAPLLTEQRARWPGRGMVSSSRRRPSPRSRFRVRARAGSSSASPPLAVPPWLDELVVGSRWQRSGYSD